MEDNLFYLFSLQECNTATLWSIRFKSGKTH